jgi:2,4-dienoyl-CoA reductase-like NADH-dependent reductase (Old Yellow Enzyme family)
MIYTGNIMIDCKHMGAAGDPTIPLEAQFDGERFEKFRAVATAAKAYGALVMGQVNHPGPQVTSKMSEESISASAVQLGESMPPDNKSGKHQSSSPAFCSQTRAPA